MFKGKKLVILTGDPDLKQMVFDCAVDNKWLEETSLWRPIVELIASLVKKPTSVFTREDRRDAKFQTPVVLTAQIVSKFASKLGMRPVPVTLSGKTAKSGAEIWDILVKQIGNKRWNEDWPVRSFFTEFAYLKRGIFGMIDADDYVSAIRFFTGDENIVTVKLEFGTSTSVVLAPSDAKGVKVDLIVTHSDVDGNINATTIKMLKIINEKLLTKPKAYVKLMNKSEEL